MAQNFLLADWLDSIVRVRCLFVKGVLLSIKLDRCWTRSSDRPADLASRSLPLLRLEKLERQGRCSTSRDLKQLHCSASRSQARS